MLAQREIGLEPSVGPQRLGYDGLAESQDLIEEVEECHCNGSCGHCGGKGKGISGMGGVDWGGIISRSIDTGLDIATNLTDPRYRPGTYSQTGPHGQIIQRAQTGPTATFGVTSFPGGSGFNDDLIKWGLIAILVVGGLYVIKK